MRASHGLTFMANYTWSRSIDDGGTFRSGYASRLRSPTPASLGRDAIERAVSTSNQPHHVVVTGVWELPIGRTLLANSAWQRAVFGGFKFSTIFQAFSGSPLAITSSSCGTNPAQVAFSISGWQLHAHLQSCLQRPSAHQWQLGQRSHAHQFQFENKSTAFHKSQLIHRHPNLIFGNTARTAPYNIYGPGNYNLTSAFVAASPFTSENPPG